MAKVLFPVWAFVSWGLTSLLVVQLLGGTFDTRSCQSDCVSLLYWSVFAVTVIGCVVGGWRFIQKGSQSPPSELISVGALFVLLIIFATVMAIGTFG